MKQAELEGSKVVDVDGSYLYRKYRALVDAGKRVAFLTCPSPLITGWLSVTDSNYSTLSLSIPAVTSGK